MEVLLEILFWFVGFVGEFLLQVVFEALSEFGIRRVRRTFQRPSANPWMAAFGYLLLGAAVGGVSLLLLPNHLIQNHALRWLNLVLSPLGCGLSMYVLGGLLRKHGSEPIRLDTFTYGFVFALAMAVVRFAWGN